MNRHIIAAALVALSPITFAAPVEYTIDANHTNVIASWNHLGYSNPIALFDDVDGKLVYDADNVAASSANVTIPVSSVNGFSDAFNKHLRSAELFDAARFPTITFESTAVEAAGQGKLRVSGNLTIKGVTRPVLLDVSLNAQGEHPMAKRQAIGFDATTTVKRSDFGLSYAVPAVSDAITIRITTEAMVPEASK